MSSKGHTDKEKKRHRFIFLFTSKMSDESRLMALRGNLQTGLGHTDRWAVEEQRQRAEGASQAAARQKLLTSRSIDAAPLKGSHPRWFFKRREEDSTHPTYALTDTPLTPTQPSTAIHTGGRGRR